MAMNFTLLGTLLSTEPDPCATENSYDSVDDLINKSSKEKYFISRKLRKKKFEYLIQGTELKAKDELKAILEGKEEVSLISH